MLYFVQFPHPEISATYGMDKNAAAETRRLLPDYAARNRTPLGAIHTVYPGIGNVEVDGSGFKFVPAR